MDPHSDLWPDDIAEVGNLVTPLAILKEQGALLAKKTNNLLKVSVENWTDEYDHWAYGYAFFLIAPILSNYQYKLLTIRHNASLYPLVIEDCPGDIGSLEAADQDEFLEALKSIFSLAETKSVIKAILAQVKDFGRAGTQPDVQQRHVPPATEDDIPF